jgi:hypothetical protein
LGIDLYNGTPAQLQSFQSSTGAQYPLLLLGRTATGGNVADLYVLNELYPWDNYIVINKAGIVRYHAALTWPHGNRYHLNEIRGAIDSLVTSVVGVDDRPAIQEIALRVAPNPAPGRIGVRLTLPAAGMDRVRVDVLDLLGRRVSTLWNGRAAGGSLGLEWDGRGERGPVAPGVYRVIADLNGRLLERRLAIVR